MISLRPVEPADIEIFYEHQADPVASAMAVMPVRDRATHEQHWFQRVLVNPDAITRTVLLGGLVVGNLGSWLSDGQRLIGYQLGRQFWGRGIATAALRLSVEELVEELVERPLFAHVAEHNTGSQRVLEKNGFDLAPDQPGVADDGIEERLYVLD